MSVDLYAVCPCGNGKKIKFCKCKDSVGQMEQILTMIEGGQVVPAMDRLKSILEEHPDAAWALAIRGRLLLDLREYDSLKENAERFIRLQPSNPLALTQRAAASVFAGEMDIATESLLEALSESGQEVDSLVMDVALVVAMGLAQSGILLSSRVYTLLSINAAGYDSESATAFLNQLDSTNNVNHLLKSIPELIERPADAEWGERYDEAVSLLQSNRVLLAQDKFESLRRTAAGQAAVLSGLFHCAIWRGNLDLQEQMADLLSASESLDLPTRHHYKAISCLLNPIKSVSVSTQTIRLEVDEIEKAEMALVADERTDQLPQDQVSRIQIPDQEVPPRSAFMIASQPLPSADESDSKQAPVGSIAFAFVFGRQTDRDPLVVAQDVASDRVEVVKEILSSIIPEGSVSLEDPEPVPLSYAMDDRVIHRSQPESMAEFARINREFSASHGGKRACELQLPILGGKSLAEVADDDGLLFERTVVVRLLEGYERIVGLGQALEDVYQISKVQPLPPLCPTSESLSLVEPHVFHRLDPSNLQPLEMYVLANHARAIGALTACNRIASALVEKVSSSAESDDEKKMSVDGLVLKMVTTPDPAEAVKVADHAVAFAKVNDLPFASVLLAKLELCLSMADQDGFRQTIVDIEQYYGNDPAVMARVQQLLMQLGIIRPDGSLRQGPPAPAGAQPTEFTPAAPPQQESGGVWTPESESAPKSSGGGKLWVPGMD